MDKLLRLLPAFLAADLILPFLLAPFYKGYRHRLQVMSALGNRKSPVRLVYSVWQRLALLWMYVPVGMLGLIEKVM